MTCGRMYARTLAITSPDLDFKGVVGGSKSSARMLAVWTLPACGYGAQAGGLTRIPSDNWDLAKSHLGTRARSRRVSVKYMVK
jgi:hypothetical protein